MSEDECTKAIIDGRARAETKKFLESDSAFEKVMNDPDFRSLPREVRQDLLAAPTQTAIDVRSTMRKAAREMFEAAERARDAIRDANSN